MATVPTVPLIVVRPKVTSQTLEFYWRPPASDGGSSITGFILTDGTLTYNITGNPGYYKVTGLTNGQQYSFNLAAINGVGTGPAAYFRSVEPGNKPNPPASVVYTDQGSGNVLVNWTNPANIGGTSRLLGMLVRSYVLDTNSNINLSSLSSVASIWGGVASGSYSYTFYGLAASNVWQFQVQLQNDPGRTLRTMGFTSTFTATIPFSPSSIGSMQLWLDATEVNGSGLANPTDGASIATWYDKSGLGYNAIGQSNPTMSTLSTLKTVYFNSKSMNTSMPSGGSNYSVFITVNHSPNSGYQRILNGGGSTSNNFLFIGSCNAGQYASFVGNGTSFNDTIVNSPATTVSNKMSLLEMIINTGSNYPFINGSNQTAKSGAATQFSTLNIGGVAGASFGQAFTGYTGEILFYSTVISPGNRLLAEGYLAWKWGISTSLQSWHPFYYRIPLVTDSNLDFSPSSIGGTQVWLDAADTTTVVRSGSTSTITSWTDKSGLGNSATAVNNPQFLPTDNSIVFNGTNQYFTLPNGAVPFSNASYSYYFMAQFSNTNAGGVIGAGSATNNSSYNIRPDNGVIRNYWYNNDILTQNSFTVNTRAAITSYYSTLSVRYLSLNYQSTVQDTPTARTQPNSNNTIGRTVANEYLSGRMNEVLVFSTLHTQTERQRIEGYLAWKWGNQSFLPPTHLYYYRPPTRLDTFISFSPSSIGSLQLWLDASVATSLTISSVSTVTQWRDLSPLGNHTDTVGGTPIVASNYLASKNSIFFNGSSYFTGPLTNYNSTLTAFIVTALSPGGDQFARIFSLSVPNSNDYDSDLRVAAFFYNNTSNFGTFRNFIAPSQFPISNASTFLGSVTYSGSASLLNYNGGTQTTAATSGLFSTTRYGVGKDPGPLANLVKGHICEILYYQSSLSSTDRQRVEGYLAWKWGIQTNLPTTHPFYLASTINLGPIASS